MTVGEKIRATRLQKEWTQKRLAEECGIAEPTIRRYELGKLNPKLETVKKIADALGVAPSVLVTWDSYPEERYKKALEHGEPIIKYLDSIGYTLKVQETEPIPFGKVKIHKPTGNIVLEGEGGEAVFSKDEFTHFKEEVKKSVEYLIWQQVKK